MNIYSLSPINKAASLVTNQSGCEDPGNETIDEARERKKAQLEWILKARSRHPKGSKKYKQLGREYQEITRELQHFNKINKSKHAKERELAEYINDIVKKRFNKFEWNRIVELARQEKRENDKLKYVNKR